MNYKIIHQPRAKTGEPLDMAPIEFNCTDEDIAYSQCFPGYPYKAFDGSVWYPVREDEIFPAPLTTLTVDA